MNSPQGGEFPEKPLCSIPSVRKSLNPSEIFCPIEGATSSQNHAHGIMPANLIVGLSSGEAYHVASDLSRYMFIDALTEVDEIENSNSFPIGN